MEDERLERKVRECFDLFGDEVSFDEFKERVNFIIEGK